jgi:hypothetical protein
MKTLVQGMACRPSNVRCSLVQKGGNLQVTAVDELSAAALRRFLEDRDFAVYRVGEHTLEASPLGSVNVTRAPSQLAAHLKVWLALHPGMPVRLDVH